MISRGVIDKIKEESDLMQMKMDVNEALENITLVYDSLFAISKRLDEMVIARIRTPEPESIGQEFMRDSVPAEDPMVHDYSRDKGEQEAEPMPEPPKPTPQPAPRPKSRIVQAAPVEQPKEEQPPAPPQEPAKKRGLVDRFLRKEPTEEEKKRDTMIADLERDLEALRGKKR